MVPLVGNWTTTLADIGVAISDDAYGGEGWGAFIATSSINPSNWTRSYSRSAYIDPLPPRPNLAVLPNATVTRLIFDTSNKNNLTATGVEWAASANADRQTGKVNKVEVGRIVFEEVGSWIASDDILALQWLNVNVGSFTLTACLVDKSLMTNIVLANHRVDSRRVRDLRRPHVQACGA